jgi:hypothetical protein
VGTVEFGTAFRCAVNVNRKDQKASPISRGRF